MIFFFLHKKNVAKKQKKKMDKELVKLDSQQKHVNLKLQHVRKKLSLKKKTRTKIMKKIDKKKKKYNKTFKELDAQIKDLDKVTGLLLTKMAEKNKEINHLENLETELMEEQEIYADDRKELEMSMNADFSDTENDLEESFASYNEMINYGQESPVEIETPEDHE